MHKKCEGEDYIHKRGMLIDDDRLHLDSTMRGRE